MKKMCVMAIALVGLIAVPAQADGVVSSLLQEFSSDSSPQWDCTDRTETVCTGMKPVAQLSDSILQAPWAERYTFDGNRFIFDPAGNYVLAQWTINSDGKMSVTPAPFDIFYGDPNGV